MAATTVFVEKNTETVHLQVIHCFLFHQVGHRCPVVLGLHFHLQYLGVQTVLGNPETK